jgi:L-asparaginase II
MLGLALSEGWPVEGYERRDHPVQRLMRETVAEMAGLPPEALGVAVDGCSVSVFSMPLASMARAYAGLATARPEGEARERALHRIGSAMRAHPEVVGGEGRFSTALMRDTGGRLIAKGGAEGLECMGIPARGWGVAVKCEDGSGRAVAPAAVALLEQLDELGADELVRLSGSRRPVLRNVAGAEVGALEATIRVATPSAGEAG